MKIVELFKSNVTRDIPPVVYFHEQSPQKLHDEVSEYIITGGWPPGHLSRKRVPEGIHEHYVKLLTKITSLLSDPEGLKLPPAAWISGFYGSGKSSFAKLLGLSLDGKRLPDGTLLSEAWLRRDGSQLRDELRDAWTGLLAVVERPLAVVFDIGGVSRGDEHIHTAVVRQVQERLGYCGQDPLVADYELRLEADGHYERFLDTVQRVLGRPWSEVKNTHMVEDDFSLVLHHMFPDKFLDPMDWINARAGQPMMALSAEDAARRIDGMIQRRRPGHTLFIVIDEVSQYIFGDDKRMLALQSLVKALEQRLKGRAWLLATGQQQLDDQNDDNVLGKMKDRFPSALRVHLASTNIRDVVHKRLLAKKAEHEGLLRQLYQQHRSNLRLFAYGCEDITEEDFLEVYPLLPEHIDLVLEITSALRTRSRRSQGDDHQIRGLLQLLGELFRAQGVAEMEVGRLITLDLVYEVQGSALDADVQNTMRRILEHCAKASDDLAPRCAKAVALLELLQSEDGGLATDSRLVARCLYANMHDGDNEPEVRAALERLRQENLLGYSDKSGYKIQSQVGQVWERDRRNLTVSTSDQHELVRWALDLLVVDAENPQISGRKFPLYGLFSNELSHTEQPLRTSREEGLVTIDFRFIPQDAHDTSAWVVRSAESTYRDRIVWVVGHYHQALDAARELGKSSAMIRKHQPMQDALAPSKQRLLREEKDREEGLRKALREAVAEAFMAGRIYFRGRDEAPESYGAAFGPALTAAARRQLGEIYRAFTPVSVSPAELKQLLVVPLVGPSRKFYSEQGELGILEHDAGGTVASCTGEIPTRVFELVQRDQGIAGADLLRHFSAPPYGYEAGVVKACVAGLLHGSKVRLVTEAGDEITSVADGGAQDLFEKDRGFKRATIAPAGEPKIKPQDRAKIRELFAEVFGQKVELVNESIADAVFRVMPTTIAKLREVERALTRLPGQPEPPDALLKLHKAIEDCLRKRQVEPAVLAVRKHFDVLREGVRLLNDLHVELTDAAIEAVNRAHKVHSQHYEQLQQAGATTEALEQAERAVAEELRSRYPWRGIREVEAQVDQIRAAYADERRHRLAKRELRIQAVRDEIKSLPGYGDLSADQAHALLSLAGRGEKETTDEELSPTLLELLAGLDERLAGARREAEQTLVRIKDERSGEVFTPVQLRIGNLEIRGAGDLEALLDEIRRRVLAALGKGQKVRLRVE